MVTGFYLSSFLPRLFSLNYEPASQLHYTTLPRQSVAFTIHSADQSISPQIYSINAYEAWSVYGTLPFPSIYKKQTSQ